MVPKVLGGDREGDGERDEGDGEEDGEGRG